MLTIVVGTGYVGRRVLAALEPSAAIGLSRSAPPDSAAERRFDLDADTPLPIDLPSAYRILYTVAPLPDADTDLRLQRFLARLQPLPGRFVYISTTGVYGDRGGALVDERSELLPGSARARRRVSAEQLLADRFADESVRLCILRVPGIYGPGRLGIERIREAAPVLREADANPGNRIHVDDLVACCLAALHGEQASGVVNVGDGDTRSSSWFAAEVARQCGLPAPPMISRSEAEKCFSARRLSFLGESRRVDLSRMRTLLGVETRYADAADGIRASLADASGQG